MRIAPDGPPVRFAIETEAVDPALGPSGQRRLVDAFNAGFNSRKAQFPSCTPQVQPALEAAAAKGEGLARKLAGYARPRFLVSHGVRCRTPHPSLKR